MGVLANISWIAHLIVIPYHTLQYHTIHYNTMGSKNGKPVLRQEDIAALSHSSGLNEAQVQEAFDAFVTEHPNGRMKPKDFTAMMSQALPKKDASKMEKHVFRAYDSNNDGYIDFVEFMVIFYIMSDGSPEEVLGKLFRVFDVNSDGSITTKDMIAKSAFAEMDKNEDGKVTLEEFRTACMGREEFSKMLAVKVIDIFVEDE